MALGERFTRPQSALLRLLVLIAIVLLGGTLGLSLSMLTQTRALDDKVQLTDDIADANVRTLSQVQRELLRLELLLKQPDTERADLMLQGALVSQRVQEGQLPYQVQTLGSEALLARSQELAAVWQDEGRALLAEVRRGGPAADTSRAQLVDLVEDLELDYNQLVSDGENNRKRMAGRANAETKVLLDRARWLLVGLMVTFFAIGVYFTLAGMMYRSFHRQREQSNADLLALNRELHKHAHVVRETDNMVVITDPDGFIEWVNKAFERTTGYSQEEVVGRRPGDLLQGPDTDPETIRRMSAALSNDVGFSEEILNYKRDGQPYWNEIETSPIRADDGNLTGFVSVQSDITERRRAEELLRSAKEAAEATAREKSNFLASMSHEIRTPLNAVLGFTDLLLLTRLDGQQREYVRTAHDSGRLLLELVNDILDFSALEAGRIEPERRAFDLATMANETIRMFQPAADSRGLALSAAVAPDVPPLVWGDETRLRQVLVNLVGNAVKFTDVGAVQVDVRLGEASPEGPGHSGGPTVVLAVTDTGVGIPAEQLPKLFQPFSQGDASTTRRFGGTGLGLAICRLLTERMGGRISVESRAGQGSTFTVEVPLDAASPADLPRQQDPVTGPDVSSLRVLVAEDDAVNQTVVVHMLKRLGITPDVVTDGHAAVAATLAALQPYDVILMDVHMPRMDGVEATAEILARNTGGPRPRIVAVTANALEGDRERLLETGMDDYLSKPLQMSALAAALGRTMADPEHWHIDEAAAAPIDFERFVAQSGIDDRGFLDQLVDQLLPQAQELVEESAAVTSPGELDDLRRRAHTVSGAASSCAAAPLASAAAALESACARSDLAHARLAAAQVRLATTALQTWCVARPATATATTV